MSKKKRKSSKPEKVSAMILKVAEGYIDMGESIEEKENYLRCACSAWNIACLPLTKRETAIKQYLEQYQEINKADENERKALEENIRLLIKQKDKLYPDVKTEVMNSRIDHVNGEDHVIVASLRMD